MIPEETTAMMQSVQDLSIALDARRFALMSLGANLITVHVVRGVDERGARSLVASCIQPGVDVRIELVSRSQAQLDAIIARLSAHPPAELAGAAPQGYWIDTDTNRVLVAVDRRPTAVQVRWAQARYGGALALVDPSSGQVASSTVAGG
jgi:Alpha-lytic protease prodomain